MLKGRTILDKTFMTPRNTAISINICNGLTPTLYFFLIPVA